MKTVALAGGVGGAKLAEGLAQVIDPQDLTIVVNVGDDFDHLGLHICPDLDTVCYTLGGIANPATGWGRAAESWQAMQTLSELGGPTWFRLGDLDLGLHLERTRRLSLGQPLSAITAEFCQAWGIGPSVLPVSDDFVPTWVYTEEGELPFQEYFVHRQCQPRVSGFLFAGADQAHLAPGVLDALTDAQRIVICPSNPWVSVDPILAIPGVRQAIGARQRPVVAVSPIIRGQTVKGPAAKMFAELEIDPTAAAVARHYGPLLTGFVLDRLDADQASEIEKLNIRPLTTDTLMKDPADRRRLAQEVLDFASELDAR
ncbi:MAG TPA: 2-phospho-L-lactate transferase [Anaerolineales bacterium]